MRPVAPSPFPGDVTGLLEAPFEALEAQLEGMWRELVPDLALFPMPPVPFPPPPPSPFLPRRSARARWFMQRSK